MFARLRNRSEGSVDDAQSISQNDLTMMTRGEWFSGEALSVTEYTMTEERNDDVQSEK